MCQGSRLFNRLGDTAQRVFPNHDAVDYDLDIVLELFVQIDGVVERAYFAVDTHAAKALSSKILEQFCVFAFAPAHHRCQHKRTTTLPRRQDLIGDLVGGLALDNATALGTVRRAHACKKQAKVVINLSYSTHRRARILGRRFLIDRNSWRKAVDRVQIGLVHLAQKLASIARQTLNITALALGIDRVKRQ